jgi:oligoendopeptidase F
LKLNTYAKLHNHQDYISATAFHDEIDLDLITNLYKHVSTFKNTYKKYREITVKVLKQKLQLTKLEP